MPHASTQFVCRVVLTGHVYLMCTTGVHKLHLCMQLHSPHSHTHTHRSSADSYFPKKKKRWTSCNDHSIVPYSDFFFVKKRNRWTSCTAITTLSCLFLRGLASVGGSCPLSLVSLLLVSFGVVGLFCSCSLSCLLLRGLASVGGACPLSLVSFYFSSVTGPCPCNWSLFLFFFCGWFIPITCLLVCWSLLLLLVSFVHVHYLNPHCQNFPQGAFSTACCTGSCITTIA